MKNSRVSTGIDGLDEIMQGGLIPGRACLVRGGPGCGKTTLGTLFIKEAAGRGERSVLYTFEEGLEPLLARCEAINIPVRAMMERGTLSVVAVEPLRYAPDEFARLVRREVEEQEARIVMIDSMSGYQLSLRGEDLVVHIHALSNYLANLVVTVLLINEVEHITGEFRPTERGVSYLADNIIFLRYMEMQGELRKVIGVLKKRLSNFEKTLREYEVSRYGVKVGKPLAELRGILSGMPEWAESQEREG